MGLDLLTVIGPMLGVLSFLGGVAFLLRMAARESKRGTSSSTINVAEGYRLKREVERRFKQEHKTAQELMDERLERLKRR